MSGSTSDAAHIAAHIAAQNQRVRTLEDALDKATTVTKATDRQLDWLRGRASTLEDALRPFAIEADEQAHGYDTDEPLAPDCISCHEPRPCKYETARRALEGEG